MNEEIKEILSMLKDFANNENSWYVNDCQGYTYEKINPAINKLLDYITTLQEENLDLAKENEQEKQFIKDCGFQNQQQLALVYLDYKSRVEKAVEYIKNKKEEYKNMTDYHQYYVEGYDKAIELTHSSHSGIMLETIKSTTIKNCDDLLNILQNGSDEQ